MRQTGRTTRIVNFAVDQIFSVGEVIVTDHMAYDNPTFRSNNLRHFIGNVKSMVDLQSGGNIKLDAKISRVGEILVVHFTKM